MRLVPCPIILKGMSLLTNCDKAFIKAFRVFGNNIYGTDPPILILV
jgi:hypothetical protein